ncbi:MAG: helix-turn-helix domain-containing protein, partial [Candidatus Omnitrophica bacterium]|nr:helix-turn-helix domain-containing protein [Candidatus Omnitrophota bacterium]
IARKKRYLHLIEKLHSGTPLTKPEIKELEEFEKEPQESPIVKSAEEVAQFMDVSERTVYRWRNEGMPVTKDGYYDLERIRVWFEEREKTGDGEGKAYWEEKIRKYRATLLELELKKATAELISSEEVDHGRIARVIAVKRSLLALPTRLAPALSMQEPREIEVILYEAISEIIDEFAGTINENIETGQGNLDTSGAAGVEASSEDNGQPVG